MFTLAKDITFEAAHRLEGHDGKCARLHGHSFRARIIFQGPVLHGHGPKEEMLVDYGDIKKLVTPLVERYLDHHYLNDTLETNRPTSEFIAHWLFSNLEERIGKNDAFTQARLKEVIVYETCTSMCLFSADDYEITNR